MPLRQPPDATVLELIKNEDWEGTASALANFHPADIADIIDHSPANTHEHLFSLLSDDAKPDVLAELEAVAGAEVVESLTNSELSDIVEEMAPDDAADLLSDLTDERSERILQLMEKEESDDVRELLKYDDESAGGIMTTDVVAMYGDQTVDEALQAIAYVDSHEPFYNANIVDRDKRLVGYVDIWELLRERNRGRQLGDLVRRDFAAVSTDTDQEKVAQMMSQYDLTVIPVVDKEGRLVGRITADDVIDVMEEEASEDIFRLAGSDDAELETSSPVKSCLVRLPWLIMTLFGGFATSLILQKFHSHISETLVLAAFVPVVLAMGGNTGIQSSTLIVRSIALGALKGRSVARLLLREVLVGAIMGCICGLIIGLWAHFVISDAPGTLHAVPPLQLAEVVSLSLFSAMPFAATFGALVPILLNRANVDPAVASGPFITITNDISALLLYFAITVLLLRRLADA